ncbi:MAG: type II toxin-antitoxin system VapC family toxin [Pseudonocardiaceae bacterium]
MTTLLLDTHVLQWWSAEPERLSASATEAIAGADELAVAAISWYELAWLAAHERIVLTIPVSSWLARLATGVRTIGITPAIAHTAVGLPSTFPGDPADRLIYATAVECGWSLVSKDQRLRKHPYPRQITIW